MRARGRAAPDRVGTTPRSGAAKPPNRSLSPPRPDLYAVAVTSENDHLDRSGKSVGGPGEEPTVRIDMRFLPMPEAESTPVFSDLSGRKRRRLRWLAIGAATVCTMYLVLVVMSIVGGANGPNSLLP